MNGQSPLFAAISRRFCLKMPVNKRLFGNFNDLGRGQILLTPQQMSIVNQPAGSAIRRWSLRVARGSAQTRFMKTLPSPQTWIAP
jgi:hypothetical protein